MAKIQIEEAAWDALVAEKDSYKVRVDELMSQIQTHTNERQQIENQLSESQKSLEDLKKQSKFFEDLAYDRMYNPNRPNTQEPKELPKDPKEEQKDALDFLNSLDVKGFEDVK